MESDIIIKRSDNILTPLGMTTAENFEAVMAGQSALKLHEGAFGLPEPFCGSLFDRDSESLRVTGDETLTFFERLCVLSISAALRDCDIDPASADTLFVLSTTKGNVELLEREPADPRCGLAETAARIAGWFGNRNRPLVVSNACVSGVCAQISAIRALKSGRYRTAVVTGCDTLSRFIVSGFQSFKALSTVPCRPYDSSRAGLNLGEGAATMILQRTENADPGVWHFAAGSNHNDANHISGPSRTGEGAWRVLNDLLQAVKQEEMAFVSTHGTATLYNDEMESIALHRAGLEDKEVCGFKGYYGHTLGAAGVIETILGMCAVENGVIPATRGFATQGTSHGVNVAPEARATDRQAFIKILSGFGGSNAGIAWKKGGDI